MKQLRLLSVTFDTEISHRETAAFRGAVIEKVGINRDFYHNHNNDDKSQLQYHYRYPLVQYKRYRKRPAIVFIDEGVNEAQHFFSNPNWELNFAGRAYEASITDLKVRTYQIGGSEQQKTYLIRRWAALNQENYNRFQKLATEEKRKAFLETILAGHILGFAKGIGHRFEQRFEVEILEIEHHRFIPFERVHMLCFDIRFKTNVLLPPFIGLGRGAARGFGILSNWKPKNQNFPTDEH